MRGSFWKQHQNTNGPLLHKWTSFSRDIHRFDCPRLSPQLCCAQWIYRIVQSRGWRLNECHVIALIQHQCFVQHGLSLSLDHSPSLSPTLNMAGSFDPTHKHICHYKDAGSERQLTGAAGIMSALEALFSSLCLYSLLISSFGEDSLQSHPVRLIFDPSSFNSIWNLIFIVRINVCQNLHCLLLNL